jgi:endonuclease I
VIARDGHKCIYCRAVGALTVDHVVPRYEGGSHAAHNLVACCGECNSLRGACPLDLWVIWCERRGCGPASAIAARVALAVARPLGVVRKGK